MRTKTIRIIAVFILSIGFLIPISYRLFIYFAFEIEDPRIKQVEGPLKKLMDNWERDKKSLSRIDSTRTAEFDKSLVDIEVDYIRLLDREIQKKNWLLAHSETSIKNVWIFFFPPSLILCGLLLIIAQKIKKNEKRRTKNGKTA